MAAAAAPSTLERYAPATCLPSPRTDSLGRWIACAPDCPSEPNVVSMFFTYGMYAMHLAKYFRHFGRDRVLVLKSEDFYSDSWSTVESVLSFARLDAPQDYVASVRPGGGGVVRRNSGAEWGKNYSGKLKPRERATLLRFYAPHNRQLYDLVGRDFGWEQEGGSSVAVVESNDSSPPASRIEL